MLGQFVLTKMLIGLLIYMTCIFMVCIYYLNWMMIDQIFRIKLKLYIQISQFYFQSPVYVS